MAIMVGTGRGAAEGILISNAEALELMEKVDTLVVDKTGTLTEGKPKVTAVLSFDETSQDDLLQAAASLENASEHPLASAILLAAKDHGLALLSVDGFQSQTGRGVTGTLEGEQVAVGNAALMDGLGASSEPLRAKAACMQQEGQTVMYIAIGEGLPA